MMPMSRKEGISKGRFTRFKARSIRLKAKLQLLKMKTWSIMTIWKMLSLDSVDGKRLVYNQARLDPVDRNP